MLAKKSKGIEGAVMAIVWRYLPLAAQITGAIVLGVLALVIVGLLGRYVQVTLFDLDIAPERLEEKQAYLDTLPKAAETAPNVVVIFFDDLGWGDLSSYGNQLIQTPRMDKAAAEGLLMTDFYSASPVCTPSRAALLTGRYPPRTGTDRHVFFPKESIVAFVRRMMGWPNRLPRDEITLAEVLNRAGYATGMVGKWHLGGQAGHRPNDFGFDSWFGVLWSNDMFPLHLYRDGEIIQEDKRPGGWMSGEWDEAKPLGPGGIDQTKLTQMYTDEAVSFLEANTGNPFFLYVAHTFPHVPHYPSADHAGTSEGGTYGDVVEDLDRSTGAVIDALDRLGLSENTIVFITSDNGADYNGSPGGLRGRKQEILEGGQRVPMIVRWPGEIAPGSRSGMAAMNIDLFPTVLSLAGLPQPQDRIIDGADISAHLRKGEAMPDRSLYYFPVLSTLPGAVREENFKYLHNTGNRGRSRGHLSRLDKDAEAHELSARHPEVADRLQSALDEKRAEIEANPRGWRTP